MKYAAFRFADWEVEPSTNSIVRDGERRQMEPRAMEVLVALCRSAGTVVSSDELLDQCWGGAVSGDNPVHKTIAQLRSLLGDNTKSPLYIETIRKRGYRTIAEVVQDGAVAPDSWRDRSPFRGLHSFGEDDAGVFFGRADAIGKLQETVAAQARAGRDMTLVLGPSGSGKTSLVQAGLVPALLKGNDQDVPLALSVTAFDLAELGEHSLPTALGGVMLDWQVGEADVFPGASGETLGERLAADPDSVRADLQAALGAPGGPQARRLVLFIDRFETVFANPAIGEDDRAAFLGMLDALAKSRCVIVILACRNDFYPRIAAYPVLMASKTYGGHFDVAPPSQAEIAQIIRLPAQAAGLSFGMEPATKARLDDVLCASAAGSNDALPLLQHTLQELFRLRAPDGELGFDAYRKLGGVEGAIGQRAEEVVGALSEAQRASLPRVLSLLVTLSERDDVVTSRRAPSSALAHGPERELVAALVDARLFVSELVGTEPGFGVAHEALLRRWPRVTAWIDEHRHALRVRGRLQLQAARWGEEARSADLLLPQGKQLDEAVQLLGSPTLSLTADELALVTASAKRASWRARLRLGTMATLVALSLLVAGLGLAALSAKRMAQERRAEAEGLMGFMLGDFADKLRPIGRLDLLDSVSDKALGYLAASNDDDLSTTSLAQRAKALQVLAEVRVSRGNPKAALEALSSARVILLRLQKAEPNQWEVVKNLGANAFWQGQIYQNESRWDEALQSFTEYQQFSDRMFQIDPANPEAWIEQSYAHTNLGQLALKRGDPETAAREFAASLALKQRAAANNPDDRKLAGDLANSLSWLGSTMETLGKLDEAMTLFGRELAVVERLHQAAPADSLWASRVATSLQRRAKLQAMRGQARAAQPDLERAAALLARVSEGDPNNRLWQNNLLVLQLDIARMRVSQGATAEVLAPLQELAVRAGKLTALDPKKTDWARLASLVDVNIADVQVRTGQLPAARATLHSALGRLQALHSANPLDKRLAAEVGMATMNMAELERLAGQPEAMRNRCHAAAAAVGKPVPASDHRTLDVWARAQTCLGDAQAARIAVERLHSIGYREASYERFMSQPR